MQPFKQMSRKWRYEVLWVEVKGDRVRQGRKWRKRNGDAKMQKALVWCHERKTRVQIRFFRSGMVQLWKAIWASSVHRFRTRNAS